MTEKFKILAKYIKDMSSETPDVETYISTGNNIGKYQLDIDIKSIAIKNKMIEVNITLKFRHKDNQVKKSHFEIIYAVAVKIDESIEEKKDLEKSDNSKKGLTFYGNKAFIEIVDGFSQDFFDFKKGELFSFTFKIRGSIKDPELSGRLSIADSDVDFLETTLKNINGNIFWNFNFNIIRIY